ncbi:MAG: HAD-IA family hydrolase [Bacteroidales bacterium]|nr:HAD-IA family hydrolase [Bacteroidales bacterium]
MQKHEYVIFDFDGTLADTFSSGAALLNSYAEKFGYNKIDFEKKRNLTAKQLIKLSGVRFWRIPHLIRFFRKKSSETASEISVFEGIHALLDRLFVSGYKLGILTTNSAETVNIVLKKYDIEKYFSFIKTGVPLFGKKRALKRAKRALKSDFVYIGDEYRDIEAAKSAGVKIISVVWGFNSKEILQEANPGNVAENTEDIMSFLI